jgi:predicted RNA-binding Zn-ribbon protein involved in translation (DUF1610 family)
VSDDEEYKNNAARQMSGPLPVAGRILNFLADVRGGGVINSTEDLLSLEDWLKGAENWGVMQANRTIDEQKQTIVKLERSVAELKYLIDVYDAVAVLLKKLMDVSGIQGNHEGWVKELQEWIEKRLVDDNDALLRMNEERLALAPILHELENYSGIGEGHDEDWVQKTVQWIRDREAQVLAAAGPKAGDPCPNCRQAFIVQSMSVSGNRAYLLCPACGYPRFFREDARP